MDKCHRQTIKVIARLADLSSMQMGHTPNAMQPIAIEFKTELERVLFRFAYLLCSVQIKQITCFRYDMVHLHRPIFGSRFDSIGRAA
jgi:hypothetical protein